MSQSATPSNHSAAGRNGTVAARLSEAVSDTLPRSVYDALTDLFLEPTTKPPGTLGPAEGTNAAGTEPAPIEKGPDAALRIEGVVLGNLPVLASAWVTQYARELAASAGGPVAMLRARSGLFTLEIVGDPTQSEISQTSGASFESLDRAIFSALRARTWVVCADCDALFADYLDEGLLDGITLLTGADEPAIVACYRNLKSLVTRSTGDHAQSPISPHSIKLAVMGATAERAREAAQRLEKAAETFLGRRPGRSVTISRIGGAPVRTLFRGADQRGVDEVIDLAREMAAGLPAAPTEARGDAISPDKEPSTHAPAAQAPFAITPGPRPHPARAPIAPLPSSTDSLGNPPVSLTTNIAGLIALPHRCPYAPEVELAVDAQGRLHLLHRAGDSAAPAVVQLLTARAWSVMHLPVLRAACPSLRDGDGSSPVMHAFTDHPKDVRGLLDTDVRLHLLARVSTPGTGEVWVCRELN